MSKTKKPKIETHAKVEGAPTTLEQVWGYNELSRYGTLDEAEYSRKISEMNRTDLEAECRRVGIVIVEASERIQKNLLTEFSRYIAFLRKPVEQTKTPVKLTDAARKVLAEGR